MNCEYLAAARLLRRYPERAARLDILQEKYAELKKLASVEAQKYGAVRSSAGTYSDPVAQRYAAIEVVELEIARITLEIRPVNEVYARLKNSVDEHERQMFLILERHIIEREPLLAVCEDLGLPERTLRRRKQELVDLVRLERRKWQS